MEVTPEMTVADLMERFPRGFAVGPGTPQEPGCLSRILMATSHFAAIAREYPTATGDQGYMVVDMKPKPVFPPDEELSETIRCRVTFPHVRDINGQTLMLEPLFSGDLELPNDEDTKKSLEKGWLEKVDI